MKTFFVLFIVGIFSNFAFAGSCCVTSSGMGPILIGVEAAKFQTTISNSNVLFQALQNNQWVSSKTASTQTLSLDGAYRIFEDYQFGVSTKLISQTENSKRTKIGDTLLNFGFGNLEQIVFAQVLVPTGVSIYDSETPQDLYTGQGFWRVGLGATMARHNFFEDLPLEYDWSLTGLLSDGVKKQTAFGEANPGLAVNLAASLGIRLKTFRVATSLSHENDSGVFDQGEKRLTTVALAGTYKFSDVDAIQISLADQTQVGSPTNSPLSRIIAIGLTRVWY